ncbi:hypothetical protein COLO4_10055 [Corchorus olitorius]|uniref:Uncharacterized protein n=1 Tax=Corchorus olitorius TaxID=93759 RepID=A0A1R3KAD0_9ROSI|nr:hypothetical protein COLO4_10055 [Corchorus olitorius]
MAKEVEVTNDWYGRWARWKTKFASPYAEDGL